MKRRMRMFALAAGIAALAGCHRDGGGDASDDHLADAKTLLGGFLKAGADQTALSNALRPKPEDYDAVFIPDAAAKLKDQLDPMWDAGQLVLKPKPEQSELFVNGATSEQLKSGEGPAAECPSRYKEIAGMIKPGNRIYCFRFRKPGEKSGLMSDGLVYLKDHWVIFPKPFRYLGTQQPQPGASGPGGGDPHTPGQPAPAPTGSALR